MVDELSYSLVQNVVTNHTVKVLVGAGADVNAKADGVVIRTRYGVAHIRGEDQNLLPLNALGITRFLGDSTSSKKIADYLCAHGAFDSQPERGFSVYGPIVKK
ncbi:hypothetical protein ACFL6U_11330 [Planctomycetota bacterium]